MTWIQAHQTARSKKPMRNPFATLTSASNACESCVTANTKPRSKNNSTMVTFW